MKILHILRSEPDQLTRRLIDDMSKGEAKEEVRLAPGEVDYARLVAEIFGSDQVICWW